jgi:hypothetical protein
MAVLVISTQAALVHQVLEFYLVQVVVVQASQVMVQTHQDKLVVMAVQVVAVVVPQLLAHQVQAAMELFIFTTKE